MIFNKGLMARVFILVNVLVDEFLIIVFLLFNSVLIKVGIEDGFWIWVNFFLVECFIIGLGWFVSVFNKKGVMGLLILLKVLIKFNWIIFCLFVRVFIIFCNSLEFFGLNVFWVSCLLICFNNCLVFMGFGNFLEILIMKN